MEDINFEEVLKKAEDGDVQSQYIIARCYHLGRHVEKDVRKAVKWYERVVREDIDGKLGAEAVADVSSIYTNGEIEEARSMNMEDLLEIIEALENTAPSKRKQ